MKRAFERVADCVVLVTACILVRIGSLLGMSIDDE